MKIKAEEMDEVKTSGKDFDFRAYVTEGWMHKAVKESNLKFNDKIAKISKDLKDLGVEAEVEQFQDYRGRPVIGVINVWTNSNEDKEKAQNYVDNCDFLGKTEVFVHAPINRSNLKESNKAVSSQLGLYKFVEDNCKTLDDILKLNPEELREPISVAKEEGLSPREFIEEFVEEYGDWVDIAEMLGLTVNTRSLRELKREPKQATRSDLKGFATKSATLDRAKRAEKGNWKNSVGAFVEKHSAEIGEVSPLGKAALVNYIETKMKPELSDEAKEKVDELVNSSRSITDLMFALYNTMLKGAGMGLHEGEEENKHIYNYTFVGFSVSRGYVDGEVEKLEIESLDPIENSLTWDDLYNLQVRLPGDDEFSDRLDGYLEEFLTLYIKDSSTGKKVWTETSSDDIFISELESLFGTEGDVDDIQKENREALTTELDSLIYKVSGWDINNVIVHTPQRKKYVKR